MSEESEMITSTAIIEISDTTSMYNTTISDTIPTIDTTSNASNHTIILNKKSSSGLSAGAICGIVIPCVATLLGVSVAAALIKGGSATAVAINPVVDSVVLPLRISVS